MIWYPIHTAPENVEVWTKISDSAGTRHEQKLVRRGRLWYSGDMYVYYNPTHWARVEAGTHRW